MSRFTLVDRTRFDNGYKHVEFFCPGCKCQHAFRIEGSKGPGPIWQWNGDLDKATFSPSLLYRQDTWDPPVTAENMDEFERAPWKQTKVQKVCHSFVKDGKIQFLSDCTHTLAGQTVEVPEDQ
jgi:hypothetical protein